MTRHEQKHGAGGRVTRRASARRGHRSALGLIAAALVFANGCEAPEPMPLAPNATWLVAAEPVAAGSPFELVLFVRAPEGFRVHAYDVPEMEGIEVVERRILPPHAEGGSIVHREAMLARTTGPGLHRWPASEIDVTDGAGTTRSLALEGLELEVPSVFGEDAPPRRPRGYRPAPRAPVAAPFAWGFGAGALAAGALAVLALRRRPGGGGARTSAGVASRRLYYGGVGRLRAGLAEAKALAATDADAGAARATLALRHFAADRYLASTHARDVDALREARPERADPRAWRGFVDRLEAIDRARFAPGSEAAKREAVAAAIDAAHAFYEADSDGGQRAPSAGGGAR